MSFEQPPATTCVLHGTSDHRAVGGRQTHPVYLGAGVAGVDATPLEAFYELQNAIIEAEAADVSANADEDEHSQGSTVQSSAKEMSSPKLLPNLRVHQWLDSSGFSLLPFMSVSCDLPATLI